MTPQPEKRKALPAAQETLPFFAMILCIAKLFASESRSVPQHVRRQKHLASAYSTVIITLALVCLIVPLGSKPEAVAFGIMMPGAGFLRWAAGDQVIASMAWTMAGLALFFVALIVWFATGNVVAPMATWMLSAAASAFPEWFALDPHQTSAGLPFAVAPALAATASIMGWRKRGKTRAKSCVPKTDNNPASTPNDDELDRKSVV